MTVANSAPVPSTCYQVIVDAMFDAGLIGRGDEPNGEEIADNMRRLNKLVNFLQTKGLKLWMQTDLSIAAPILQLGLNLYSLGPAGNVPMTKPRRVIEAYFTSQNAVRRPISIISRNEWDTMSTVTTQGTITAIYPDKQLGAVNVYTWLSPSATEVLGTLHLIVDLQVPNFAQITDLMAFPPEWELCLEWGLAHQISTGQPEALVQRCKENAFYYQTELEDWDVEDASTSFRPDSRGLAGKRFG